MRSREEFEAVVGLVAAGLNDCQISRLTGVPRGTVRYMRVHGRRGWAGSGKSADDCPLCGTAELPPEPYAYLLGLYLGDGCITSHPRGVYRLAITLDLKYPSLAHECGLAIAAVRTRSEAKVGWAKHVGCVDAYNYWKHWPCLFPQHGPGPKHARNVSLVPWQDEIVREHPGLLLRGLIHSDGCRNVNVVKGSRYPRYLFKNFSFEIQQTFTTACERMGLHWTRPYWNTISVARTADVAKLDRIIGPKS